MVLVGLVTAWRLASWPTSRSPVLVNATTDGTVRPPSADGMTVGSPPSMTATTEFVVPRSMPMILPIGVVAPVLFSDSWIGSAVGISVDGFGGFGLGGAGVLRDGDQRRPDHPVTEPVAAAQLLDDLAAGAPGPGHVGDRFVLVRVEMHAGRRVDARDALAVEQGAELAIDGCDALDPGLVDAGLRPVLDGEVEVVGDGEDLADQALGRQAEHRLALLAGAALEVDELRTLALERGEVLVPLARELVEVALARAAIATRSGSVAPYRPDRRPAGLEPRDLLTGQLGL